MAKYMVNDSSAFFLSYSTPAFNSIFRDCELAIFKAQTSPVRQYDWPVAVSA